jgi:hypothetical protein
MYSVTTYVDKQFALYVLQRAGIVTAEGTLTKDSTNLRPTSPALIRRFSNDMIDNNWRLTHEDAAIGRSGECIDGKHRFLAVLEAYRRNPDQQPIPMRICYNADPATFPVVNSGKSRNTSDVLAIHGIQHSSRVAHAAKLLYCYNATRPGHTQDAGEQQIPYIPNKWARVTITNTRIIDTVDKHPGLLDNLEHTGSVANLSKLSSGALITARYLITKACGHPQAVHGFYELLRTGQGLPYENHPAFTLRDWALRQRRGDVKITRSSIRIAGGPLHLRLLIQMWNHAVEGNSIEKPSYSPNGLVPAPSSGIPGEYLQTAA